MMLIERLNPLAPPWLQPELYAAPPGMRDDYYEYSLLVDLVADTNSLDNPIDIIGAGCFYWLLTGIQIDVPGGSDSPYIWFQDHEGRYLSNEPLHAMSFAGPGEYSAPLLPPIIVPGGSQITVDLYEVNSANLHVNVVLRGIQRRPAK